ncbi:hypothetical protein FDV58_17710 [Bradyrhizobium elkanii]|uniref:Uncharacterized protein n=1 Tax=Bradyrhizobium elkanii TaxID=29448 RepID=A0A4U6RZV8_BRAEL|nr:hypothetical protein [Bradyrhizobium elkanii]TKV80088.1 hypothetical protein FDV58_17710 [Bradyrhizobium elkanii]
MFKEAKAAGLRKDPSTLLLRLRRVEIWRMARFVRLLEEGLPTIRIRAGRLYLDVGARRMAVERGLI